jgi:hypothetical protein
VAGRRASPRLAAPGLWPPSDRRRLDAHLELDGINVSSPTIHSSPIKHDPGHSVPAHTAHGQEGFFARAPPEPFDQSGEV